jgi:hypothetical protein
MRQSTNHRLRSRRATLSAVVVIALVLAQTLGLVHRIVHAPLHVPAGMAAAWSQPDTAAHASATSWLQALFGGHHHDSDCDAYDKLAHGDAVTVVPVALLPPSAPSHVVTVHASWHVAAQSAGFLARGPPALV